MNRRIRVLVDATNCKAGQGGVRTYTIAVCNALALRGDVALVVATSIADFDELPAEIVRLPPATQGVSARVLWRERRLAACALESRADLVFTPVPELPLRRLPVPSVMVVHDIGPAVAPDLYGRSRWLRYRATLPRTLSCATKVVCVSEATRDAVAKTFKAYSAKCVVIGEGPQPLHPPVAGADLDLAEPYVLYVGSLYRHKNVPTLVRAWRDSGLSAAARLRMVGPTDDVVGRKRVIEATEEAGVAQSVAFEGFVSPSRLAALVRGASAVALPSLYEGFGLPALEAMAAGVPVVASAIPAFAELLGDAGILVQNPKRAEAWNAALSTVLGDKGLQRELIAKGRARAREFTWDGAAVELARVFAEVAA